MPDNLPIEIQEQIIKRLPVKSLIRSRSVCKSWKSLIDSSSFIANYSTQQQHLLLYCDGYDSDSDSDPKYVSIVDDDAFPEHRVFATIPPSIRMLEHSCMKIGSCHGLLCLYGWGRVVIWNPSIRKTVTVVVPNMADDRIFKTAVGFGVCRKTRDPKIVKITYIDMFKDMESVTSIPRQVEVFTLSAGTWRSLYSNLPRKSICFKFDENPVDGVCVDGVCVDGVCYWLANDRSTVDDEILVCNMIISFDMTSEEFGEVNLPDHFVYEGSMSDLYLYNLRESLVVVDRDWSSDSVYNVWMMKDGARKSFIKLFTINNPDDAIIGIHEFRKSGEPVIEVDYDPPLSLTVYEPNSKHIRNLGSLNGINEGDKLFVHSYNMETLLLLDQPPFTVFKYKRAKNRRLLKYTSKE